MNPKDGINSHAWWEAYFDAEWERHGGPEQTRHFMQRLIEALPALDRALMAEQNWSILDWGCAFGDGTAELARAFAHASVSGLELSSIALTRARQRYPAHSFLRPDESAAVGTLPGVFDIVVNSNALEHFTHPLDVLRANLAGTKLLHLSLVPYREEPLSVHHVARFDEEAFPAVIGGFERAFSNVIDVDPKFWPSGKQLLVGYASADYLRMRATFEPRFLEQQKWDRYYRDLPVTEVDPLTRAFGEELVAVMRELLPDHARVLEAGCGGGQQSLALAHAGFDVTLLDFSQAALDYAKDLFAREGMQASLVRADAFTPGAPDFDLVFNAGVLEHYGLDEQARFLRGMASRSRGYVLVLIPNRACYWYWVWRIKKAAASDWPFGKEVPQSTLADAFAAAGLEHLGECYLGASWSEYFIESDAGIDAGQRRLLLELHRSPVIPALAKGYLTAALGRIKGTTGQVPGRWQSARISIDAIRSAEQWTALLADALAGKIAADERAREMPRLIEDLAQARDDIMGLQAHLHERESKLRQTESEHESTRSLLAATRGEADAAQATANELRSHLHRVSGELQSIQASRGYRWLQMLYRWRLRVLPRGSRREQVVRLIWRAMRAARHHTRAFLAKRARKRTSDPKSPYERAAGTGTSSATFDLSGYAPRLARHAVIVLPIIEWGFRFQRPQQIARQFAQAGHPILFASHKFAATAKTRDIEHNVVEIDLPGRTGTNPYRELIDESSAKLMATAIIGWLRGRHLDQALCLIQLPFWAPVAEELRRVLGCPIVYDCMDDHAGFSSNTAEMLSTEHGLLKQADLVVASSGVLLDKIAPHARRTLLVRNAADYAHFATVARAPEGKPGRLTVGYYGAISDWFDSQLVGTLASERHDWQFVLIGDTWSADLAPLQAHANIRLTGEAPYATLPAALRDWDCCIIPFRRIPLTEATNPVKVYEMLAAGLPVVAVDLPELRPIAVQGLIRLAGDAQQFAAAIEDSVAADGEDIRQKRREFARANTWADRFAEFDDGIRALWPLVSIVVVTFNNLELNRLCIASLLRDTDYPNFELIVVDNGSTDGTPQFLRETQARDARVNVVLNTDNRGFSAGNNQGVAAARGEYLCLLNNDTIGTSGWLSTLIGHLRADTKLGLVGPVTNATSNEARIDVGYRRIADMPGWADQWCAAHRGQLSETSMLAFFCVAFPRRLWDQIGALDERFGKGMFEDDDYCRRVRAGGYSLKIAFDSYVHHWQRASFVLMGEEEYYRIYGENQRRYRDKYGERHLPLPEIAAKLAPIRAHAAASKGVFIFPPSIGWAVDLFQRPQHLARAAALAGYTVVFDCTTGKDAVDVVRTIEPGLFLFRGDLEWLADLPNIVLWTFPYNYAYRECFAHDIRVVYDWIDDLDMFPYEKHALQQIHARGNRSLSTAFAQSFGQEALAEIHERALAEADVVACVAKRLHENALSARSDALYLPNAAEQERFARVLRPNPALDDSEFAQISSNGKPIAGYYGALADWFDYDLLLETAQRRPDWNFVLIGPDHDGSIGRARLHRAANVHWLGPRNYHVLPGYLELFDVALVLRVTSDITRAMSPLKLYEYFSGRKPVIASPVPECAAFNEVRIVRNAEEFAAGLDAARADGKDPAFLARLAALAAENTWTARLQTVLATLADRASLLPRRGDQPDAFVFSAIGWHTRAQRSHQIARTLAQQGWRVFFVSPQFVDAPAPGCLVETIAPDLSLYQVRLHLRGASSIDQSAAAAQQLRAGFAQMLVRARPRRTLALAGHPFWWKLSGTLPNATSVYDCGDQSEVAGSTLPALTGAEDDAIAQADAVLAAAPAADHIGARRAEVTLLRNAADFDFFASSLPGETCETERRGTLEHLVSGRADPWVSVIVLTYNNLHLTQKCLESIERWSDYANLELIVVDNASSDGTVAWLRQFAAAKANVSLILNDTNRGFAAGNNQGLAAARGDYLVLLNNDTVVTPGWIRTMVNHFKRAPRLGLLGPVSNGVGNEARVKLTYATFDEMPERVAATTLGKGGMRLPLRTAAFFCVMIRRALYSQIGGLREDYGIGFFEDDDYCRSAEQAGWEIACAEDVFVHHELSAAFDKMSSSSRKRLFKRNRAIYEKRWGKWQPHLFRWQKDSAVRD